MGKRCAENACASDVPYRDFLFRLLGAAIAGQSQILPSRLSAENLTAKVTFFCLGGSANVAVSFAVATSPMRMARSATAKTSPNQLADAVNE